MLHACRITIGVVDLNVKTTIYEVCIANVYMICVLDLCIPLEIKDNLIITYTTNGDWDLGITHLAIGNCENDWVPLNGAGNPIIGQFDYTEPTSTTASEVVYVIPLADFDLESGICFAAHAEVNGPNGGETAWAQGDEFAGRSWAMYVQTDLSDCGEDDDDGANGAF